MSLLIPPTTHGLALLANKCAPNTFDLSSGMVYASMRDQIVRAQLLLRDLKASDPLCGRVLVVGGGVAGVAAACMASDLGVEAVLVDTQPEPFSLQARVSTRFVGPFMYEWPGEGHDQQHYPAPAWPGSPSPSTPRWQSPTPLRARDLADQLRVWLYSHTFPGPEPRFFFGCGTERIKSYVNEFVAHHGMLPEERPMHGAAPRFVLPEDCVGRLGAPAPGGDAFEPQYIVLAAGMGVERVTHPDFPVLNGPAFWCDDDLRKDSHMDWHVGVLGSGDGALQDVLRLITRHEHPLEFIRCIESSSTVQNLMNAQRRRLEALEHQTRLFATWNGNDSYAAIDQECSRIAATLASNCDVRAAVRSELRPGSGVVHHILREPHFGKAYLLNRFVVHLIEHCATRAPMPEVVAYTAHRSTTISTARAGDLNTGQRSYVVALSSSADEFSWDRVLIRYGADQETLPRAQMIRIRAETAADRISLAGIPLPYIVPRWTLHP